MGNRATWTAVVAGCAGGAMSAARAQQSAAYEIVVADHTLAPGESTLVTVKARFKPEIGAIIVVPDGQSGCLYASLVGQSGCALGLESGGFDLTIDDPRAGSFSGMTVTPPYNFLGTSPGAAVPGGVEEVSWSVGFFLSSVHPLPANPGTVWKGTFTGGSTAGTFTLTAHPTERTCVLGVPCPFSSVLWFGVAMTTKPGTGVPIFIGCYPDCDGSGMLSVADFGCFQTRFVTGDPYADCDGDTQLGVADFGCFQSEFVAGCP